MPSNKRPAPTRAARLAAPVEAAALKTTMGCSAAAAQRGVIVQFTKIPPLQHLDQARQFAS
jgi:hypothetical protein